MAKKISVLAENKQWHTFKGGDVKFYTNPEFRYVEVVRITDMGNDIEKREVLAGFHNYIMVKDTSDSVDAKAVPGPVFDEPAIVTAPPAIDRYTQAALDSRGKENHAPDFGVLDEKRPIETVTQGPLVLDKEAFLKDHPGAIIGKEIDFTKPEITAKNMMSPEYLKPGELAYESQAEEIKAIAEDAVKLAAQQPQPKIQEIIKIFGLKKGSDLLNLPKPADGAAAAPSASDLEAPEPGSEEMEAIFASVEKKWKKDGVGRMNEKQYGEWMGRLEPSELAALITQHQADVKKGLVKMADPADAPPPDLPDSAVEAAKPARRPRKPRATAKEHAASQKTVADDIKAYDRAADAAIADVKARHPEPEPDTPEEDAEFTKPYKAILEAEQRHTRLKKKMCVTCHDMGTVPDPQNPENSIMCPSC